MNTNQLVEFEAENQSIALQSNIRDMLDFTKSLIVNDEGSYNKVTSLYSQAKDWKKHIDNKRKEITEPYRRQVNFVNDKAKILTDILDQITEIANLKASSYLSLVEEKKKKEHEELIQSASLFGPTSDIAMAPIDKNLRGNGASLYSVTTKNFKVVDLQKVPLKYLQINEDEVLKDIKLGLLTIPGLEIYEETTTKLRKR